MVWSPRRQCIRVRVRSDVVVLVLGIQLEMLSRIGLPQRHSLNHPIELTSIQKKNITFKLRERELINLYIHWNQQLVSFVLAHL